MICIVSFVNRARNQATFDTTINIARSIIYLTNGLSSRYHLDQPTSLVRVIGAILNFIFDETPLSKHLRLYG